jgi:CRP-like cAMP-binding protein
LYVIASGRVKLLRHSFSGKNVLLELLVPGDFFGSLSSLGNEVYPDTAQAQTSACVLAINAEEFRLVLDRYPAVALKVLDVMAERLQAAHEMVRQLSVHSVERRLAFTLLRLAEKLGKEQEVGWLIQAPLSRDDLAEMTGTTTESASRVMSQFQKEGLIRSGRQWIAITDREGLQSAATEEIE